MCEFCESGKRMFSHDNFDEIKEVYHGGGSIDIPIGANTSLYMAIEGDSMCLRGHVTNRTRKDCHRMHLGLSILDERDDDYGTTASICEKIKIRYCPMCGRRLDGPEIELVNAMSELNEVLMDSHIFVPLLRVHKPEKEKMFIEVTCFGSNEEFGRLTRVCDQVMARGIVHSPDYGFLHTSYWGSIHDMENTPVFPVDGFLSDENIVELSSFNNNYQCSGVFRTTPAQLLRLKEMYVLRMFDGYDHGYLDGERMIANQTIYNQFDERIKTLRQRIAGLEKEITDKNKQS